MSYMVTPATIYSAKVLNEPYSETPSQRFNFSNEY